MNKDPPEDFKESERLIPGKIFIFQLDNIIMKGTWTVI